MIKRVGISNLEIPIFCIILIKLTINIYIQ